MISEILALGPELARFFVGKNQQKKADELSAGLERPEMQISAADTEALALSRVMAGSRNMPGFNLAKEGVEGTFANAIFQSGMTGNPNVPALFKNKTDALKDIAVADSQFQERSLNNLVNQLGKFGALQRDVFDFNEVDPYYETTEAIRRLEEGGLTNMFNALSNTSGAMVDMVGAQEEALLSLLPGMGGGTERTADITRGGEISAPRDQIDQAQLTKLINLIMQNPAILGNT